MLVIATTVFLSWQAQCQFTAHVRKAAARELALDAAGQSPWQWPFRTSDDIVAGTVFGAHEFAFDNDGLRVRSDGVSFEIGVPLARPLDLQRFPIFHIDASADAPATLRLVLRTTLEAPESMSAPIALREQTTVLDLSAQRLPKRAAMVRLRFDLPAGHALHLRRASLGMLPNTAPAPIRELPRGSVERQMLALRQIHADSPAAIVVPAGGAAPLPPAHDGATADATGRRWIITCLFVVVLILARMRPPRSARLRALTELVLVLAVPMWLIVGGQFNGHVDSAQATLIAATSIYALTLVPRTWRWNGTTHTWMLATAIVVAAFCVGFAFHRADVGMRPIGSAHVLRYFGWALAQQYLICAVCLERWRVFTSSAAASIYLSALCFALLHTPNSTLMLATFAGGLCWGALYLRERALLPLAYSHAASALLLIALLPPEILLSAEVSARFFQ